MATANSRRNKNALNSDLYTTPHWATAALLKREKFEGRFLDAGCGKGDISKVLQSAAGYDVDGIDLHSWGWGTPGIDFLKFDTKYPNVISNPPFTLLGDFINHAIELADNKVAIFARINALETKGRFENIYKDNPPTKIYLFVNRVKCLKGGHDDGESSAVLYCWMVWDKADTSGETKFEFIDDEATKKERPKFNVDAPAIHISDVRTLLDETLSTFRSTFTGDDMERKHIVSVSGGKDSDCAYAIANIATEGNFEALMCDTDNEHPETMDFVRDLHNNVGNGAPRVNILKAKFTEAQFEARRMRIAETWTKPYTIRQGANKGVIVPPMEDWQIREAIEATRMTDNAMLNSFILHGAMASRQARSCTKDLKIDVAFDQYLAPALAEFDGEIINWSGVRAEESEARSDYKWVSEDPRGDGFLLTFLPIHKWLVQDVFALHKYLGFKPNPLYMRGASRVGCWPCIMSRKAELREVAVTTPGKIIQLRSWEEIIEKVSRYTVWQNSRTEGTYGTSFMVPRVGQGKNIHDMVAWSMTNRGGDEIEYSGADMNCKIGDHIFCE